MFRVATFNAGLAVGYLPYVTERVAPVVEAIARLDADVVFVQEFWLDAHWDALRRATATSFPHALRPAPVADLSRAGCTEEQLAPLVACANRHCAGLRDEALAACVVRSCASHGLSLSPDCLNCIARDTHGTIDEIAGRCIGGATTTTTTTAAPANAKRSRKHPRYGALLAYGGSFGTGLLSKHPLEHSDVLVYEASVNARGAVHAKLQLPHADTIHVFGTHFSPGGFEVGPQVDALLEWIEQKAPASEAEPVVLLGDLNLSPGSAGYRTILRAGFREPDTLDSRGTYGGQLGTAAVSDSGWRIDHVLVRDVLEHVTSRRIFDDPVRLPGGLVTTLSDHFGVCALVGDA